MKPRRSCVIQRMVPSESPFSVRIRSNRISLLRAARGRESVTKTSRVSDTILKVHFRLLTIISLVARLILPDKDVLQYNYWLFSAFGAQLMTCAEASENSGTRSMA